MGCMLILHVFSFVQYINRYIHYMTSNYLKLLSRKASEIKPYLIYDQWVGVVHLGERENYCEGTRQIYSVTSG